MTLTKGNCEKDSEYGDSCADKSQAHLPGGIEDRFDSGVNELIIGIMPDINNKLKDIKDHVERGIIKNLISKRLHLWKDDDILCP